MIIIRPRSAVSFATIADPSLSWQDQPFCFETIRRVAFAGIMYYASDIPVPSVSMSMSRPSSVWPRTVWTAGTGFEGAVHLRNTPPPFLKLKSQMKPMICQDRPRPGNLEKKERSFRYVPCDEIVVLLE